MNVRNKKIPRAGEAVLVPFPSDKEKIGFVLIETDRLTPSPLNFVCSPAHWYW